MKFENGRNPVRAPNVCRRAFVEQTTRNSVHRCACACACVLCTEGKKNTETKPVRTTTIVKRRRLESDARTCFRTRLYYVTLCTKRVPPVRPDEKSRFVDYALCVRPTLTRLTLSCARQTGIARKTISKIAFKRNTYAWCLHRILFFVIIFFS